MKKRRSKKTKWLTKKGLGLITEMAECGASDKRIAEMIGISQKTLCHWKKEYPEITEAIDKGRSKTYEVENSLFLRAIGVTVTETTTKSDGTKIIKTKCIPPSFIACMLWLVNRMPGKWKRWKQNRFSDLEADAVINDELIEAIKESVGIQ